jgi:hypothetical protein
MRSDPRWLAILIAAALVGLGCGSKDKNEDGDTDVVIDTGAEGDGIEDSTPDIPPPDVLDTAGDSPCTAPPTCPNAPADHERYGQPCISELDCGTGNRCLTESVMVYNGETYVSWLGGTCALWGADEAGCDPDDPATCPPGTSCVNFGTSGGSTYYGCVDACKATDTSWNPYDWNCGCREGYECNINLEACLPGCANDRECCEVWDDLDEDYQREDGEVYTDDTCTNWCDGNGTDEYPGTDCQASFACINEGDPDATWHSECLFESDCPADGRCLNEVYYYDDETGDPYYPDGLCLKDRCELMGRGCGTYADTGGECVNLGSTTDPFYACIASCQTGYGPEDGDLNPCRHPTDGTAYTCTPYPTDRWFPASSVHSDGLCFPAVIADGTNLGVGETCTSDEECVSPLGLGSCWEVMGLSTCTVSCNQDLTEDNGVCGAPATAGDPAPGVCIGLCVAGCDTPRGDLGSNGCPTADLACYPNDGSYNGGDVAWKDADASNPAGFCLPKCVTSTDCASFWSGATTCNPTTGVCGV